MRGATKGNVAAKTLENISTHTPHAGRDSFLHAKRY